MPSRIARRLTEAASRIILGKEHAVRLALACILARGHLLIEDIPGVGKTTLAHVLARLLGLQFQRIQFTSDMLPADIIGVSIFDQRDASFRFHPGPVFAQLLLADEINRATPKAQSALLEAMEERQISAEGQTWRLPEPFFVIATQNPADQIGTFPLPESQLDRFLMRISLGYPDRAAERALLAGEDRRELVARLPAVDAEDAYRDLLRQSRHRDRAAGRTLAGPQASDLEVRHGPKDIPAGQGSTGEQKALLIGVVLGHAALLAEARGVVAADFQLDGKPVQLSKYVEIAAFRIVQEALANVAHHAGTKEARVRVLYTQTALSILVEDKGKGFDPEAPVPTAAPESAPADGAPAGVACGTVGDTARPDAGAVVLPLPALMRAAPARPETPSA